jgi:hypothetical protein
MPCPEPRQFFRFAVRQVVGKPNFSLRQHARVGSALGARLVSALRPTARMAACYKSPARLDACGQIGADRHGVLLLPPPVRLGRPLHPARHITEQDRSS